MKKDRRVLVLSEKECFVVLNSDQWLGLDVMVDNIYRGKLIKINKGFCTIHLYEGGGCFTMNVKSDRVTPIAS